MPSTPLSRAAYTRPPGAPRSTPSGAWSHSGCRPHALRSPLDRLLCLPEAGAQDQGRASSRVRSRSRRGLNLGGGLSASTLRTGPRTPGFRAPACPRVVVRRGCEVGVHHVPARTQREGAVCRPGRGVLTSGFQPPEPPGEMCAGEGRPAGGPAAALGGLSPRPPHTHLLPTY